MRQWGICECAKLNQKSLRLSLLLLSELDPSIHAISPDCVDLCQILEKVHILERLVQQLNVTDAQMLEKLNFNKAAAAENLFGLFGRLSYLCHHRAKPDA